MTPARRRLLIERLTWVLLFGGLATMALGQATRAGDASLGWWLIGLGALATAAGVLLIWVRSRLPDGSS